MKQQHFWIMSAATAATMMVGAGTAGLAQQRGPMATVIGERADQGRSVRVSYRDLNLAVARDEQILKRRVGSAARYVCEPEPLGPISDHIYADCVSYAWNGARPQVALAVRRAKQLAQSGASSIPLVAIAISAR